MRRTPTPPQARRGGFTMVELLVVMTIIAILVALVAAAVTKVIGKGDEVRARNEITQLATGIQAFKTKYQVSYVPDTIVLKNNLAAYNLSNPLEAASLLYLKTVWPRLGSGNAGNLIPWDGQTTNGRTPSNPGASYVLQGHQALVFFLGGARPNNGTSCIGFSSDPTNPMETTSTSNRDTFYDFSPDRLFLVSGASFPSYKDAYGTQPYLYFSATKAGNDYSAASTQLGVSPYVARGGIKFANANSFQIVCAGKDGQFGAGGKYWAGGDNGPDANGADDMANFHPVLLGVPSE